jgi:hypothetical protein
VDLSGANLGDANLTGAYLENADLSGADLSNTDLSNADLTDAINLTQAQLDQACGTPVGFKPGSPALSPTFRPDDISVLCKRVVTASRASPFAP